MIHTQQKTEKTLRIIPLGGLGEVGRNMMVLEYDKEIIIIDVGIGFPDEDMPGVDFIIPNPKYLEGKQKQIRGIIFTHGHFDHVGALPYLINQLGNPVIYTAPLTRGMIMKRHEDFQNMPKLKIVDVKDGEEVMLGRNFRAEFIHVNHTIPDDMAMVIKTPIGNLFHTSDYKFDEKPVNDKPAQIERLRKIGEDGILLMTGDSTGVEKEGHSLSESVIQVNLEEVVKNAKGRVIAATFSSLLTRIQQLIYIAEKLGRKVVIEGFSMRSNVEIAKQLGYMKIQKGTIISAEESEKLPLHKVLVLGTGAQGESRAFLMRVVTGEHRVLKIEKGDTLIFSSSVIPGNERAIQSLKDAIYRQGGRVFHYNMMDIHASGHGHREDLKQMIGLINPEFFMPVHGNYSMLVIHGDLAESLGIPRKNIVIAENGDVILAAKDRVFLSKEKVPANYIMVDGLGVGDVSEVVLRDRQVMSKDGMFVIITVIDSETGKVKGNPDIISRGFIYMKESQELLAQTRKKVKEIIAKTASGGQGKGFNWLYVRDNLRDRIGQFLYSKTKRRPMILPVVIEI